MCGSFIPFFLGAGAGRHFPIRARAAAQTIHPVQQPRRSHLARRSRLASSCNVFCARFSCDAAEAELADVSAWIADDVDSEVECDDRSPSVSQYVITLVKTAPIIPAIHFHITASQLFEEKRFSWASFARSSGVIPRARTPKYVSATAIITGTTTSYAGPKTWLPYVCDILKARRRGRENEQ